MMDWIERRKKSGMSQFLCAQSSGVSRMRLSLAETGQVKLTPAEESAIYRALNDFISERALEIRQLLLEQDLKHAATVSLGSRDASANSFPDLGKLTAEKYGVD